MAEIVYGYMNRCECGNLYLPTGRDVCNPCHRKVKEAKWAKLKKALQARREAKAKARSESRRNKLMESDNG